MASKVVTKLAEKYSKVREGVKNLMGGRVLDYEAKHILNEGIARGKAEGRAEGKTEGRAEGLVELGRSIGWTDDQILAKMIELLKITKEEAGKFLYPSVA